MFAVVVERDTKRNNFNFVTTNKICSSFAHVFESGMLGKSQNKMQENIQKRYGTRKTHETFFLF